MIKPTALWNAMKTCKNSKALGDAMRKLGKQDVDLDEYAQFIYETIVNDNEWMEEQIAEKRENERIRQQKYRQRKLEMSRNVTVTERDKRDVTVTGVTKTDVTPSHTSQSSQSSQSSHTSQSKSKKESSLSRTRDGLVSSSDQPYVPPKHEAPTWEDVKLVISNQLTAYPISEAFAREWFEAAEMSDWRDTRGQDMRPGYVWKRKLQLQWNELLKEQRKANGGKTDAEKQSEEERLEEIRQRRLLDENGRDD